MILSMVCLIARSIERLMKINRAKLMKFYVSIMSPPLKTVMIPRGLMQMDFLANIRT